MTQAAPARSSDKNGNPVRFLSAGKGSALRFVYENLTVQSTGHNVIILFPTDFPAGPPTIQYVGRVTYTVDTSAVFTLRSVSGKSLDIRAALS